VRSYLVPLRSPSGVVLGLANMVSFGLLIVATTWYGDVLATEPALPATLILIGFSLATVAGRFGGWVARALNERAAVALTLGVLCALLGGAAAAIALDAPDLLAVALVGTGAGFGLPVRPAVQPRVLESRRRRGRDAGDDDGRRQRRGARLSVAHRPIPPSYRVVHERVRHYDRLSPSSSRCWY
jgi:MFS family permease